MVLQLNKTTKFYVSVDVLHYVSSKNICNKMSGKKHAAALVIHYIIQHGDDDLYEESGNVQNM